jgi:hypothetical protein
MKVLETNFSSLHLPMEDTVKPSCLDEINFVDKSNLVLIRELHSHNTLSHQANDRLGLFRACIYFNQIQSWEYIQESNSYQKNVASYKK